MKASKIANAVAATISSKGDASLANNAGRKERITILTAIDTAEDLLGTALLAGLRMTAEHGPTSKDEVAEGYTRCKSPDVYASWFNRGAKAAAVIGIAAALQLIDKAGAGTGGFQRAREALASIVTQAKTAGVKEFAPKAAKLAVQNAVKESGDKSATRKAAAKPTTVVRSRTSVTMAAAALECGKGHKEMAAFIRLASNTATRLPEREGKESLHREAVAALAHACELWQVLAK